MLGTAAKFQALPDPIQTIGPLEDEKFVFDYLTYLVKVDDWQLYNCSTIISTLELTGTRAYRAQSNCHALEIDE